MSFFNFVLFKNIYLCPIMERNHTKAINVDLLLEQITTEDNRLAFHRLFELYYPALCMYANKRRYRAGRVFRNLGKSQPYLSKDLRT